jgi:hypothetical protein
MDADCDAVRTVLQGIRESEWLELVEAAAVHRIAPLLFSRISELNLQTNIPVNALKSLEHQARATGALNTLLLSEHERILRTSAQRGVTLLPLKGAHLITCGVYRADQRPMTDLDYAAQNQHIEGICAMLTDLGYHEEKSPNLSKEFTKKYAREYHYTRMLGGVPVVVEVHDVLIPHMALRRAFPLSAKRLVQRAHTDADGAPTLLPEHALLFCILHFAVVHRFSRLIWLADIDHMCRFFELNWDFFEHETRSVQAEAAVYAVLRAASNLFGTAAPAQQFAYARGLSRKIIDRRAPLWLAGTAPAPEISAVPFALCRRPLRTLVRYVFPPADFMALRYGVPATLAPAWSVARPVILAVKSLRASQTRKMQP